MLRSTALLIIVGKILLTSSFAADPVKLVVMLRSAPNDDSSSKVCAAGIVASTNAHSIFVLSALHNLYVGGDVYGEEHDVEVMFNGFPTWIQAQRVQGFDGHAGGDSFDWVLLEVKAPMLAATFSDADFELAGAEPVNGSALRSIGYPRCEKKWSEKTGLKALESKEYWDIDFDGPGAVPGSSGGGLIDSNGHIVGMIIQWGSDYDERDGRGTAISIDHLIKSIKNREIKIKLSRPQQVPALVAQSNYLESDSYILSISQIESLNSIAGIGRGEYKLSFLSGFFIDPKDPSKREELSGEKSLVAKFSSGDRKIPLGSSDTLKLSVAPESFTFCTMTPLPNDASKFIASKYDLVKGGSFGRMMPGMDVWSPRGTPGLFPEVITEDPNFCKTETTITGSPKAAYGPIDKSAMPFPIMHVATMIRKRSGEVILMARPIGSRMGLDEPVNDGRLVVYVRNAGGSWRKRGEIKESFRLSGMFDQELRAFDSSFIAGDEMGFCTYRTVGDATLAAFETFSSKPRPDGEFIETNAISFRRVSKSNPCAEFIR